MNDENLIPHRFTASNAREKGRKGGLAAAQKKRDRRTWKEIADELASRIIIDKNGNIAMSPITGKPMSIREGINTKLLQQALQGNLKAINILFDISGEKTINNQLTGKDGKDLFATMTEEEMQKKKEDMLRKLS